MDPVLSWMQARQGEIVAWIRGLVEIESPSRDEAAVRRAADYVADLAAQIGKVERTRLDGYGDLMRIEPELPAAPRTVRSSASGTSIRSTRWARSRPCPAAKVKGACGARACST
ncbi:MAG: hypothetical protein R2724_07655 [Bryobacterales bacterium]